MVKAVTKTFSLPLMPQGNRVRRSAGVTGVRGQSGKNPVKPFPASKDPISPPKPLHCPGDHGLNSWLFQDFVKA